MFKKPFTVKKNTLKRNSDSRKLFSRLKDEVNKECDINKRSQVAQVKLTNFEGTQMNVYTIDKIPMLFDFDESGNIYPSVYYLWRNSKTFPVLICPEPVFSYLENGADLMLPGVMRSSHFPLPSFRKAAPVAIAFYSSETGTISGPSAVGCSIMSSEEMIACGFKGKGVHILHIFRDHLWELGPKGLPPTYTTEEWNQLGQETEISPEESSKNEASGTYCDDSATSESKNAAALEEEGKLVESEVDDKNQEIIQEEPMENLLTRCFLAGLKHRFTRNLLPMDVGQFYSQCVLSCVPDGRKLDVKKTHFKKFAIFLEEINELGNDWIIKITASKNKKGADCITDVNFSNRIFQEFEVTDERIVDEAPSEKKIFDVPVITEFFCITEPTLQLFSGFSKGELLTIKQVKEYITRYVNENKLASDKSVRLDPVLFSLTRIQSDTALWEELTKAILGRMTATWQIRWPDGREIVRKVSAPRVEFKIENRAGNKKVTLVNGLAMFGIDIRTICHQIQTGVATSVTNKWEVPGVEGPQVLVQGNQIHFLIDLLIKSYGIEKKFMKGTELAVKKKK